MKPMNANCIHKSLINIYVHLYSKPRFQTKTAKLCEFTIVPQPIRFIWVDWFVFHLIFSSRLPFFYIFEVIFVLFFLGHHYSFSEKNEVLFHVFHFFPVFEVVFHFFHFLGVDFHFF
jgi:hypothetical protein